MDIPKNLKRSRHSHQWFLLLKDLLHLIHKVLNHLQRQVDCGLLFALLQHDIIVKVIYYGVHHKRFLKLFIP